MKASIHRVHPFFVWSPSLLSPFAASLIAIEVVVVVLSSPSMRRAESLIVVGFPLTMSLVVVMAWYSIAEAGRVLSFEMLMEYTDPT